MDIIISGNPEYIRMIRNMPPEVFQELGEAEAFMILSSVKNKEQPVEGELIPSVFNYHTQTRTGHMLYNTLYNALVRLSDQEYAYYTKQEQCPEAFRQQLIENGLWVSETLEERQNLIRYCYYLVKYQKAPPQITVTTTMECNARCFYCYEHGVPQRKIQDGVIEQTLAFIDTLQTKDGVKINWFGGEPLLNPECIDTISQALKDKNISYHSYIITNGSLVTDELIGKMNHLWNTRDIQITIDGTEEVYCKRKRYTDDKGDYYDLLWKIKNLADHDIRVHIRINIDADNAENVCYLVEDLEGFFGKQENITYYPAFLEGIGAKLSDDERVEILRKIFSSVKERKKTDSTQQAVFSAQNQSVYAVRSSFLYNRCGRVCVPM